MFSEIPSKVLMRQAANRIGASAITLVAVSLLFFSLIEILPGDFAEVSAGRITSFTAVDKQRAAYGLDQNVITRYGRWLSQAVQGEFGDSWWFGEPIGPLLWTRLKQTLWLAALSAVISIPLGFVLGVLCAMYVGRVFDRVSTLSVLSITCVPEFVIAYVLMYFFAVQLSLFPVHTFFDLEIGFWERVHATILPALSLAGISVAPILRLTRATVLNIFQAPFIQMAHLKGLTLSNIARRHALPNVIAPVCTMTVLVIANLIVGVVIVESIFTYPGFGEAMLVAARNRDMPLALACGIISGALYLLLNLIADLVVLFSNPRLRHPSSTERTGTWIVPRSIVNLWQQRSIRLTSGITALLIIGLSYSYYQWSKTDGVTHSHLNPPLWFRTTLLSDDLLNPTDYYLEPVHFDNFLPVGTHAPRTVPLEGTLTVPTFQLLSRVASRPARWPGFVEIPGFEVDFISVNDRIVPAMAGAMLATTNNAWLIIVDEGRAWSEPGDAPWSRASFPFTFVHYDQRTSFSGAMTFIYNQHDISNLRIQIAQESSPDTDKLDFWGQTTAKFTPRTINDHARIEASYLKRQRNQIDVLPWSDLESRFATANSGEYDREEIQQHTSVSGVYFNDSVYLRHCRTRFGPFPFCRSYRHSVYSMSQTLGSSIAMLHFSQVFGPEIFDARVLDYVNVASPHDGWRNVTFGHLLDMSTGIGDATSERVDHFVSYEKIQSSVEFFTRRTAHGKLKVIDLLENYPWDAGEVFRYQDTHGFLLSLAMKRYLDRHLGAQTDVWETLQENVFTPLGLGHLDILRTEESNGSLGIPLLETGIYPTFEQVLKLARLIQNDGRWGDIQLLHPDLTAKARDPAMARGLPTGIHRGTGGEDHYDMGLWLIPYHINESCAGRTPTMVGKGGSYVSLMPNNIIAFRFADGWSDQASPTSTSGLLRDIANDIGAFCEGDQS